MFSTVLFAMTLFGMETRDLAKEMPEKAAQLRQKLKQWRRSVNAQEMTVNPNYDPEKASWKTVEGE